MQDLDRSEKERQLAILRLAVIGPKELDPKENWWTFPSEGPIKGFHGVGPIMIIGDQPSMDPWPEWHPSRRLLYGCLTTLDIADTHLTDVIKRRGRGSESKLLLPVDLPIHLDILRQEIGIIQPSRVIALGRRAEELLVEYIPGIKIKLRRVMHSSHAARFGRHDAFECDLRAAILS